MHLYEFMEFHKIQKTITYGKNHLSVKKKPKTKGVLKLHQTHEKNQGGVQFPII